MNSWIMRHWLKTHKKEEYPDLCIRQENDVFHVLPESRHPPEESIRKMCSSDFFSQHKYNYVEKSIEEFGNPPASPPYEEPVRDHSQYCVAKGTSSNEDLGYAWPLDERMRSLGRENATLDPPYKNTTTLSGTENQNLDYAQQNAYMNETYDYAEVTGLRYHSGMGHNKSGAHIAAIGFKDKNNKKEGSENGTYPSLSIHNENQTGIPMEAKYQCPRENRGNPVGLEEKGETQSYQSETEFEEQGGDEIYGPVFSSADPNENAILEVNEVLKNALVEDSVNTIHYKKPTGIPNEKGYRFPKEHCPNQANVTEKDETQSYESRKAKLHHKQGGKKEVVYDTVIQNSGLKPNENAILEEVRKQKQNPEKNADSVSTKYASLTIHYKKPTGVYKEPRYKPLKDHSRNQADMTEKDETQSCQSRETKLQEEQEGNEEVMYDSVSSDPQHNENAVFKDLRQQEQKKNADSLSTKCPSQTIHYKKPTGVPKETENQCPREHRKYQADVTERDEAQGNPPKKRTKLQLGHENNEGDNSVRVPMNPVDEEEIYGAIALSADTNENAILEEVNDSIPMNPEDEGKNARPGEMCNQKQSGSQEEDVRMAYSLEDDSGASTEDTLETLSTEEMKEDDHGAQSPLPTGEVPHQPSPFRRRRTIWRKRKSPETKKQRARKAKHLDNKENAVPGYGSEKEFVREQVPKEVNKQDRTEKQNIPNEISPCLLQRARMERHISTWDKQFSEIEMNLDI